METSTIPGVLLTTNYDYTKDVRQELVKKEGPPGRCAHEAPPPKPAAPATFLLEIGLKTS